jgi:hypothetical protein
MKIKNVRIWSLTFDAPKGNQLELIMEEELADIVDD